MGETLNNHVTDTKQSLKTIKALYGAFMLAFRQPYTNTAARSYAGTFIQHDNLNILRRYLHKPYLPDCLIALITLQFGALSRLHSRFSWVYKHVSIQMWQTPSTVSSGVALVLHSWIHPTYLDGHVKNQVPFLQKQKEGTQGERARYCSQNHPAGTPERNPPRPLRQVFRVKPRQGRRQAVWV